MKAFPLFSSSSLLLFTPVLTAALLRGQDLSAGGDFDGRMTLRAAAQSEAQMAAVERLRQQISGVGIDFDSLLGTARVIAFRDGVLSPSVPGYPAIDDPHRPVKVFLDENQELFGAGAEILNSARITREETGMHDGIRTVVWSQHLDGVPVFGAVLTGNITRRGELLTLCNVLVPSPEVASGRSTSERAALYREPAIRDVDATVIAARNLGEDLTEADLATDEEPERTPGNARVLHSARLKQDACAQLAWLPMSRSELRLCWNVSLARSLDGDLFELLVDAQSGEVHLRRCLTSHLQSASYRVFTGSTGAKESPTAKLPGWTTPSTNQPATNAPVVLTLTALSASASPLGWINDGGTDTVGNNIDAFKDIDDDTEFEPAVGDIRPSSGSRQFLWAADFSKSPTDLTNVQAAVVNAFYWGNWMHDVLYDLGFSSNNFQGTDKIVVSVQTTYNGGAFNDRTTNRPPHLTIGTMCPGFPRDVAFDATVLLHEYTHGLVRRRAVDNADLESKGLAEGWGDFISLALLSPTDTSPATLTGSYPYGAYAFSQWRGSSCNAPIEYTVTENYYYGSRRFPYSVEMSKNPLTLVDLDTTHAINHRTAHGRHTVNVNAFTSRQYVYDTVLFPDGFDAAVASEYHNMGEIWCSALWDVRMAMMKKYEANGSGFTGNTNLLRIVLAGMNLYSPGPTFLQAREGVLQADRQLYQGANQAELWSAFYKRGMGPQASVTSNAGPAISVIADFNRADYDLNGHPDLLLQGADSSLEAWSMLYTNGNLLRIVSPVSKPALSQTCWVVGTADVDQDGRMDLFVESNRFSNLAPHLLGYRSVDGGAFRALEYSQTDPAWHIVGTGDFHRQTTNVATLKYRDTQPDLLWQNEDNGNLAIWWMDGTNLVTTSLLNPANPGPGWKVVGTGDFNKDGRTDIVFQHASTQYVAFWYMNGQDIISAFSLPFGSGGWNVVGTVDANEDKNIDLLLQLNGALGVWYFSGTNYSSAAQLAYSAGARTLVGPK